jgi:hypothetical protein
MNFKEQFLELAIPFFELIELDDGASEEVVSRYYEVDGRIEPLKAKLSDLAEGDQSALDGLVAFFTDEQVIEFLNNETITPFLKILALASNITSDTWNSEVAENPLLQAVFLSADEMIDQPYSASGGHLTNFFYNSDDVADSVALVDFRSNPSPEALMAPETWSPQGQDIIEAWTVILLLGQMAEVADGVAVISSVENTEQALSYLKYHLVMSGHKLTLPMPLTDQRAMSDVQQALTVATDYTEFTEPFGMLGEINSSENILDTFLSTYHVLENYMIRSEVSSVLSNSTGRSFQRVRDFKRLGQQTDASEVAHLTKLFKQCWEIQIGGRELQETLAQTFNAAKGDGSWVDGDFDDFLVQLGLLNGNGNQITLVNGFHEDASVRNNFAKLVYSIRCSIVHNKATEFHLSNEELRRKNMRVLVIVKLCLPVMYRLAFGLPSSAPATNPIHYERRDLMFY